jgi:hypothetical protein
MITEQMIQDLIGANQAYLAAGNDDLDAAGVLQEAQDAKAATAKTVADCKAALSAAVAAVTCADHFSLDETSQPGGPIADPTPAEPAQSGGDGSHTVSAPADQSAPAAAATTDVQSGSVASGDAATA